MLVDLLLSSRKAGAFLDLQAFLLENASNGSAVVKDGDDHRLIR